MEKDHCKINLPNSSLLQVKGIPSPVKASFQHPFLANASAAGSLVSVIAFLLSGFATAIYK